MLASMKRQARRHSNPVSLAVLSLATAASTVAVVLLSGALTSEAVQDPTLSLDMDPGGNSYNDTTNTMTVGTIDNCLTEPGNAAQHNLQAHLIIQNVEDVAGIQARFNFDSTKAKVTNFINAPFQDTSRIQNVGFLNLPLDPAIGNNHRDLTGASDFSAPNTALVAASYLGDQTFPISPDTPAKSPTPDDTSYSAPTGGIFGTVVIQVQDGQAGQSSLAIDLDDGDPILPGSSVDIFTGGGIQNQDIEKVNLEGFRLGDGFIGNGVTCVPLPQETPPAATPTATPTPTVTPTPCPGCTPTPTVTPPPRTPGGSFDPQISQTYSTTEPGSHPDIASTLSIGLGPDGVILTADDTGGYNFGGIVNFSPSSPQDADVPDGAILGELKSVEGLGVLNNPCNRRIDIDSLPPKFTFMEATTDNTNTVEALPFGFGNELAIIAGDTPPFDGIQDVKPPPAVTKYPAFLNAIFDPDWVDFGPDKIAGNADDNNGPAPPIKPRFRFVGVTSIGFAGGLWTVRQEVVFEPGTKLPRLPAFDPSLGFPSVTVLQQSSAAGSATPPAPSAITDSCTPLKQDSLSLGVTHDNPDTPANEGGIPVRTLPGAGTPITSTFYSFSQRDADGDGFENTLDTCPFNFDALWNPHSLTSPAPDDDDVVAGLHTGDGIPNTCDPTPTEASGNQPTDHDNDGFANSGDNCPLHYNPDQADSDVNADGEIVGDGIGDACDTPGTDAGFDCVGAGCSGATPRPIPPRTVSGKGPNVPDGEPLLCVRLITVTVGGPNQAAVSECLEQAPPLVPVDAGAPVDGDGDQVSDAGDNCPATPNADQLDSDQDGIGDVCDPTPVHDLTVVGVKAHNATLRLQPVGTAIMHVRATVQNVVNYPETLSLGVDVAGLPAGCEVAGVSRDTTGSIRRLGKSTYQLEVSITCAASLAVPGTYPLTLTATVTHTGSGIENNTLNNSGGATARLRIR